MKMISLALCFLTARGIAQGQKPSPRHQAEQALRRGVAFFRNRVAVEGTYLWEYSEDLSLREGEGVATATQGWVQPPGTPAVGMAFLQAYEATGDDFYLDTARETADGLRRGQLRSGGWYYSIDFSAKGRGKLAYRVNGKSTARNVTTLDDDTTQAALRFLMRLDRALHFRETNLHETVVFALRSLVQAQYPNGAWPQGYDHFPDPASFPVRQAALPQSWPRVWPGSRQYWYLYTLNDNVLANMVDMLFEAERLYSDPSAEGRFVELVRPCRQAALKAGDFLILAQMPEPQPAWAQQYDFEMHPAWARKFEPPAITGGESQGVLRSLLKLYRETGKRRYLEPVPRALAYLRRSRLPDGRLARFYELGSNRPLYFTRDYRLTYDGADAPSHYSFKVPDTTDKIAREYERLTNLPPGKRPNPSSGETKARLTAGLVKDAASVIQAQDGQGRWIEEGGLRFHRPKDPSVRVIRCATFIRNVATLSRYLAATKP